MRFRSITAASEGIVLTILDPHEIAGPGSPCASRPYALILATRTSKNRCLRHPRVIRKLQTRTARNNSAIRDRFVGRFANRPCPSTRDTNEGASRTAPTEGTVAQSGVAQTQAHFAFVCGSLIRPRMQRLSHGNLMRACSRAAEGVKRRLPRATCCCARHAPAPPSSLPTPARSPAERVSKRAYDRDGSASRNSCAAISGGGNALK
jgi:hypothetical protein